MYNRPLKKVFSPMILSRILWMMRCTKLPIAHYPLLTLKNVTCPTLVRVKFLLFVDATKSPYHLKWM